MTEGFVAADCVICCVNLAIEGQGSISSTPCGHCFHTNCIKRALTYSRKCPTCRRDFRGGDEVLRTIFLLESVVIASGPLLIHSGGESVDQRRIEELSKTNKRQAQELDLLHLSEKRFRMENENLNKDLLRLTERVDDLTSKPFTLHYNPYMLRGKGTSHIRGRRGRNFLRMQSVSGAMLHVVYDGEITITGSIKAVTKANEMVWRSCNASSVSIPKA